MSDLATVYATFASHDEAVRIGRAMVGRHLAACVNVLAPCNAIYRFEGQIAEAQEVPALFKTTTELAELLIAAIAEAHSYRTPAIVSWSDDVCHPPCARWIKGETLAAAPSAKSDR